MNMSAESSPIQFRRKSEKGVAAPLSPTFRRPTRAEGGEAERITNKFQPSTCHRCSEITLRGIVAEGYLAHLDPTPLNATSEAAALAAGRVTWHMTTDREVTWRTSTKIAYRPAGNHRDYAVFAEHRCHQPIATSIDDWAWSASRSTITPEEPQF